MANFKQVNKAVSKQFPELDVEVVRGDGYIYFAGKDGYNKLDCIYTHPTVTTTEDVIRLCVEEVKSVYS